ncbi:MAG: hypothetical protein H0V89_02420 [Deltaproteobacteria bacterium]|nr:hypothetical protein [Deltaproteobacteria bacterium]
MQFYRYVTPLIFTAMAVWVAWYNGAHDDRYLMLPFIDRVFPGEAGDPRLLAQRSVQGAALIAGVSFLWAVVGHVRFNLRRRKAGSEDVEAV